ncbi:hypothetical protein MA16_Dca002646 [Dendrobium catenatum]|uniref:Uncharacterized protein n=1 Tax=Dendrobium catenatum TaxID=906689 RepID=A0A2I0W142_9ASPA|nr:hypothetical protein MA16_Dca002646 [Dendrobium catenatum]
MHPPKQIRTKNDSLLHHNRSRLRRLLPPRLPVLIVLPITERTKSTTLLLISNQEVQPMRQ